MDFAAKADALAASVLGCSEEEILQHLDRAGIIPECFEHDSSEEKLFAKYCDALLTRALNALGLRAEMIGERADAADVIARTDTYSIVADAKAFRLSRTAKNQKDFKIEALDKWRRGAKYACLVGPIYQFPRANSQIYLQASRYNVTLLSYTHLAFLIRSRATGGDRLRPLWEVPRSITPTKDARAYWSAVRTVVTELAGASLAEWQAAVRTAIDCLPDQATEQIAYWEAERSRIAGLKPEVLRRELIKALKIDSKIAVIRAWRTRLGELTGTSDF
jgi:hypothetical protein